MVAINKEETLTDGTKYIFYPPHRNGNPKKSQWTISQLEELDCFKTGYKLCLSIIGKVYIYWGVHVNNGSITHLGDAINNSQSKELFIAKFVDSTKRNEWHGYPADHVNNYPQDVPDEHVLKHWNSKGLIRTAAMRKILGGKKCNL